MNKNRVGRPKKTVRNPFIFRDGIITNPLRVIGKVYKNEKKNGEFTFDTVTVDQEKNDIHICHELLIKYSKKGSDTTETAIFLYMLSKLYDGREQLTLDPEEVAHVTGFSVARVSRVLGELSKLNLIRRKSGRLHNSSYWINPHKIFKGNRISYVKKNSKDKEEFDRFVLKIEKKDKQDLERKAE